MKNCLLLFSSFTALFLLTACETINSGSSSQNNQFANSNQDIIELQNDVAVLKRRIVNVQNDNARILKNISSLQSQINYVNEYNQKQNKAITVLHQQITKERAERQAALDKVVETVADQTTKAVNTIAKQSQPKTAQSSKTVPAGAYYKHKVAKGETLSAIARAYKVSVKDIKQTNSLKSNLIGIGQILHIPKK